MLSSIIAWLSSNPIVTSVIVLLVNELHPTGVIGMVVNIILSILGIKLPAASSPVPAALPALKLPDDPNTRSL